MLACLLVCHYGKIQSLLRTRNQTLLNVKIIHRHNHLFLHTQFFLTSGNPHHIQIISRHIIFTLSHPPVNQRNRNTDRNQILLQRMSVGISQFIRHLVKTHTGIKTGIETGFFLCLVHILFRFQHILPLFQESRIILFGPHQRIIYRNHLSCGTSRYIQFNHGILIQIQKGSQ